jgi:hypothetical protein
MMLFDILIDILIIHTIALSVFIFVLFVPIPIGDSHGNVLCSLINSNSSGCGVDFIP